MNVRIFWVRAMKCMYAQTRPRFILSTEGVFLGNGVWTHVNSKGKICLSVDLFIYQENEQVKVQWLLGCVVCVLSVCRSVYLSIRRMRRSRYNDCLAVWCVFCLFVDLFIYLSGEWAGQGTMIAWLCGVCCLSMDLFIYQSGGWAGEGTMIAWLCGVCCLSMDLFIYQSGGWAGQGTMIAWLCGVCSVCLWICLSIYQEDEQVKVQWLLGCVVCVLSVCGSVYLSIRRMSRSRYNDCLAVWCVFCLPVDLFIYLSGEWAGQGTMIAWLCGVCSVCLWICLSIYQENEQVKVQWLLGCVVCVLSVCRSVYVSGEWAGQGTMIAWLCGVCSFCLWIFFLAFPSYISGVHHFWVRFLRMWRFFNLTIKVVTFRLRGWCVLGVFLLPAFTRLGHERQDLLSPCDEMHVCTD